jgi:hypothetical protein
MYDPNGIFISKAGKNGFKALVDNVIRINIKSTINATRSIPATIRKLNGSNI